MATLKELTENPTLHPGPCVIIIKFDEDADVGVNVYNIRPVIDLRLRLREIAEHPSAYYSHELIKVYDCDSFEQAVRIKTLIKNDKVLVVDGAMALLTANIIIDDVLSADRKLSQQLTAISDKLTALSGGLERMCKLLENIAQK